MSSTNEREEAEDGFGLLRAAMEHRAQEGETEVSKKGFERAGKAIEVLVRKGEVRDRGFRRTIAAAGYQLAGFSARANWLLNEGTEELNPGETALKLLIQRKLDSLRRFVQDWLNEERLSDEQISAKLSLDQILADILNTAMCRALAEFDMALETGEVEPLVSARSLLASAVSLADNAQNVPLWWLCNLCLHLLDELWAARALAMPHEGDVSLGLK